MYRCFRISGDEVGSISANHRPASHSREALLHLLVGGDRVGKNMYFLLIILAISFFTMGYGVAKLSILADNDGSKF